MCVEVKDSTAVMQRMGLRRVKSWKRSGKWCNPDGKHTFVSEQDTLLAQEQLLKQTNKQIVAREIIRPVVMKGLTASIFSPSPIPFSLHPTPGQADKKA